MRSYRHVNAPLSQLSRSISLIISCDLAEEMDVRTYQE
ncbi:hypothetical protein ABIF86_000368 [Bradyrhizobium japonicum]